MEQWFHAARGAALRRPDLRRLPLPAPAQPPGLPARRGPRDAPRARPRARPARGGGEHGHGRGPGNGQDPGPGGGPRLPAPQLLDQEQAERVRYVKTRHSYVIERPVLLERSATMAQARQTIRRHNASGILIEEVKGSGLLAGILSHRDMPIGGHGDDRPVSEFMTPRARLVTRPP